MKRLISSFTACLILCGIYATAQVKTSLDGRSFSITLTQSGAKKAQTSWHWGNDELQFMSGKMLTSSIKSHERFAEAKYVATAGSTAVKFTCIARNSNGATLKWSGTIQGNKISGTVTWKNASGSQTYSFTGTAK